MTDEEKGRAKTRSDARWLIYMGALVAGVLLLADAFSYAPIQKITARLGIGLLFSAVALLIGSGRPAGYIATVILWVSVGLTFVV